jgi:hypothetical protein
MACAPHHLPLFGANGSFLNKNMGAQAKVYQLCNRIGSSGLREGSSEGSGLRLDLPLTLRLQVNGWLWLLCCFSFGTISTCAKQSKLKIPCMRVSGMVFGTKVGTLMALYTTWRTLCTCCCCVALPILWYSTAAWLPCVRFTLEGSVSGRESMHFRQALLLLRDL